MAGRGGFEPPIDLRLCRISSAVRSTTPPPARDALSFSYLLCCPAVSGCSRIFYTLRAPRFGRLAGKEKSIGSISPVVIKEASGLGNRGFY